MPNLVSSLRRWPFVPAAGVCLLLLVGPARSLDPIQGYREPIPTPPSTSLTQSRVADQVILKDAPAGISRGTLALDKLVAYRERGTGRVRLTVSGEDAGAILNPERPHIGRQHSPVVWEYCYSSRWDVSGTETWIRNVRIEFPQRPRSHKCISIVDGQRSHWIQAGSAVRRLGRDGQIMVTVSDALPNSSAALAANVDPVTDDLLLISRQQGGTGLLLRRLSISGQVSTVADLPLYSGVAFPQVRQVQGGEWQLLAMRASDQRPWLLKWNADFSELQERALDLPLAHHDLISRILDVRWLDSSTTLILLEHVDGNAQRRGFRLAAVHADGSVSTVVESAEGRADRLFRIPDYGGRSRYVFASHREAPTGGTLTLHLLSGTDVLLRQERAVVPEYLWSAIGESGEFLLVERAGSGLNVQLFGATGQPLESKPISLVKAGPRSFLSYAHGPGHFRWATIPSDSLVAQSRISMHDDSGALRWETEFTGSPRRPVAVDSERLCLGPVHRPLLVECFSVADGTRTGVYEVLRTDCNPYGGDLVLRAGKLFLGDCPVDSPTLLPTLNQRAVALAPDKWRAANGDVLWPRGAAVIRLDSQGNVLNIFGDPGFGSPSAPISSPIRLLADGSYVFARETPLVGGRAFVTLFRVSAAGALLWTRQLDDASMSQSGLIWFDPRGDALEVIGDHVQIRVWVSPSDPQNPDTPAPGHPASIVLAIETGEEVARHQGPWGEPHVIGDQWVELAYGQVRQYRIDGSIVAQFRVEPNLEPALPVSPAPHFSSKSHFDPRQTSRVIGGRLQLLGQEYPLPQDVLPIRHDQEALDGAFEVWQPGVRLKGQGLVFDYLERDRLLFGAWFHYAMESDWQEADLRWLTLSGTVPTNAAAVSLGIYETTLGRFDAPPVVSGVRVGTAELELDSCETGLLRYRFDAGPMASREGTLLVRKVAPQAGLCTPVGRPTQPAPEIQQFGFSTRQSGGYYEPGLDGQGLMLQVRPDLGPAGTLFGTWFTFDPEGQSDDPGAQHWLTLQGTLANSVDGWASVQIVRANGGESFIPEESNDPVSSVHESVVGEARISFQGCGRATVRYRFDESELAGRFAGRQGTMDLEKPYACE